MSGNAIDAEGIENALGAVPKDGALAFAAAGESATLRSDPFEATPIVLMRGIITVVRHGKRWAGTVRWDRKSCMFTGCVRNGSDIIRYCADSMESLVAEFEFSIDEYVDMCIDDGSGRWSPG